MSNTGTGRVDYLDGIRAIAIGAVLSLHWLSWYSPFLHGGSIGVDIFFVLSGFIITTMLWRSAATSWLSFIRRRVVRLYPALLGLVVGSIVLYAALPSAPIAPFVVVRRGVLVLVQGSAVFAAQQHGSLWLPSLHPFGQTWSLAIEWYFYLLWPLVVFVARRRGVSARVLCFSSLLVAAVLYAVALPLSDFWFYFGPSARFAELLVGAALALWFQAAGVPSSWRFSTPLSVLALVFLGAITVFAPAAHSSLYRFVDVPVAVLSTVVLICAGYSSSGPVVSLLSHPWMAGIGRASYSLYLWHIVPILLLENGWLGLPRPVLGVIVVVSAVLLTWLSYRFLEKPFLRPRSDVLKPRPLAAVEDSEAA